MTEPRRIMPFLAFFLLVLGAGAVQAKEPSLRPASDRDCLAACRERMQKCLEEARPKVDECLAGCQDLMARARRICAANPSSDECRRARFAANACLQGCREPINECIRAGRLCAQSCTEPVDPCRHCREEHQGCLKSAAQEGRQCAQDLCSDEFEYLRRACEADPRSDECRKAHQQLNECVEPCREKYKALVEECREALRLCRVECAGEEPAAPNLTPNRSR
jgi:hypothetical protein